MEYDLKEIYKHINFILPSLFKFLLYKWDLLVAQLKIYNI